MHFNYNSRDLFHKKPFGAVPSSSSVSFCITAKDGVYVHAMSLVVSLDGYDEYSVPMSYNGTHDGWSTFQCELLLEKAGLYWYKFAVHTEHGEETLYRGADNNISNDGACYQLTVYDKEYTTPKHLKGGIIYHIFADRFYKGVDRDAVWDKTGVLKNWNETVTIVDNDGVFRANDFYGGNLAGITEKLDYLKSLGVTLLYLSPIFKSGSNHRYDTGDYMKVDELLGSEKSLVRLISEAKKIGMGVMLDGVFNHTGSDSLYFNKLGTYPGIGAYGGDKSPYFDWFSFDEFPHKYNCWWGITVTPTVNKSNPGYRKFILGEGGVIDKWTKLGLAGWRLDVVDELDSAMVTEIRKSCKRDDNEVAVIGEVWEDASSKIAYSERRPYLLGGQLDGVMNYPYKEAIIKFARDNDSYDFMSRVMTIYENYPLDSLNCCMTFLGTHDTVRAINSLADRDLHGTSKHDRLHISLSEYERNVATKRLKVASVLQYVLPGVPSIYYGDEIGLEGYEDPINRKPFPWDSMDKKLLDHYKTLGQMREKCRSAMSGTMDIWSDHGLLHIVRSSECQSAHVILNNCMVDILIQDIKGYDWITGESMSSDSKVKSGECVVIIDDIK